MIGRVHSIQSLGTVDGPGVRFVVFFQGCNLRCGCCHNPDTWEISGGTEYTPSEIVNRAIRYREYFSFEGGITLSGGEPLLQAEFAYEIFKLCHKENINTCLDTSGSVLNESVKKLLTETDRVLLDIKYTNESDYKKHAGCSLKQVLEFLDYLNKENVKTTIRQVIIPSLNDNKENISVLKQIKESHSCVDKVELLSFRKICQAKYDNMGKTFKFADFKETTKETIEELKSYLK